MPRSKRPRRERTHDWQKIQQYTLWPEQKVYELLRPVVLFNEAVAERAQETGSAERTLYRKAEQFEEHGMASLFPKDLPIRSEDKSRSPLVIMVEPTQNRNSHHLVRCTMRGKRRSTGLGKLLLNTLMRSCLIEVRYIQIEYALELLLAEDQQVVKAFLSHTPHEAFADGIGTGCMIWGFKNLDSTRCCHTSKARPKFAIVITKQIHWRLPIRCSFSQLLRHPGIGRRPCHAYVDYPPRFEFDDEKRKERSKEEIRDL